MRRKRLPGGIKRDCTAQAKQVWRAVYPREPWPKGWKVEWAGWMRGALGLCARSEKRIVLSLGDARRRDGEVVATLIHEFVHVRCRDLRHGPEFYALVTRACERVGIVKQHDRARLERHEANVARRRAARAA